MQGSRLQLGSSGHRIEYLIPEFALHLLRLVGGQKRKVHSQVQR